MQSLSFPPTETIHSPAPESTAQVGQPLVGQLPHRLSDEEREDHIRDCSWLMELAYARYAEGGNFADRGEADRWMRLRDEAVRGRSASQVARMEAERGLA